MGIVSVGELGPVRLAGSGGMQSPAIVHVFLGREAKVEGGVGVVKGIGLEEYRKGFWSGCGKKF